MFIKVCGITNEEDAQVASSLGVDAVGFIFYENSPRKIDENIAKKIINSLPKKILKVGVFVDEKLEKIKEIVEQCNITALQLHGNEEVSFCKQLKEICKLYLIKAFRINSNSMKDDIERIKQFIDIADYILIDTHKGVSLFNMMNNFNNLCHQIKKLVNRDKLIIAGGLNKTNVCELINFFKPYGVDIASGVEEMPGKKDHIKLKEFIEEVRRCTP